ncbi:JAB1/Mov34/MPN/PAD-1 ubiquitin protease-domain-containing protein [Pisolithus croceorrhizus]|nr:JAB1/Mov34/MPN/PAD-1 ubiquitin protease-domain-containing protein [Pisolithus croceorrhizus]KAI6127984.1 JAB1/Mov34/MPN/PAD-1 ubiquitin protease-domain-containing protein [Pisolithus croceorrhizus]
MYEACSLVSFLTVLPQMLKHGHAGVLMEVMGLMLGEFVDEYTVQVVDVFAMPQSSTTVTVESVDHVFQMKMVDMLKQTGQSVLFTSRHSSPLTYRSPEMVVGWYHSHLGFGCWLSSVDINTQQVCPVTTLRLCIPNTCRLSHSNKCKVAASPLSSIQFSLKGKVVIDAFRLINPQVVLAGREPRQTTSNIGHINKPSIQALVHGLNRHYYSIVAFDQLRYQSRKLAATRSMMLTVWNALLTHRLQQHASAHGPLFVKWCAFSLI